MESFVPPPEPVAADAPPTAADLAFSRLTARVAAWQARCRAMTTIARRRLLVAFESPSRRERL